MSKKVKGKIKSITVKKATEGMQVFFRADTSLSKEYKYKPKFCDVIGEIIKIESKHAYVKVPDLEHEQYVDLTLLKTLVVEFYAIAPFARYSAKQQIPLKYSQWKKAIDNEYVDNDKTLLFDVINIPVTIEPKYDPTKHSRYAIFVPKQNDIQLKIEMYKDIQNGLPAKEIEEKYGVKFIHPF